MVEKKREASAKLAHIEACLTDEVEYKKSAGFAQYDFENQACPEISLDAIDLSTTFLQKRIGAPLMIAPMTGGVQLAHELNRRWARAAEHWQIPMAVGSQRVGLEDATRSQFYQIRQDAPTTVVFGNIGAGQLVRGWGVDEARRAVEMIKADALFIHLNAIQEACQGGDVDFLGLLNKITLICEALTKDKIPVFAREVGFGLSQLAAKQLIDAGVSGLDCAGAGGTSWAKAEALCAKTERRRKMGERFAEWGIPTTQSILNVRSVSTQILLIATGGIRSGQDIAKALVLGADVAAMARPMLAAAYQGEAQLFEFIEDVLTELRITMFGIGASTIAQLKQTNLKSFSS